MSNIMEIDGIRFRDRHDGDELPRWEPHETSVAWQARILVWFCPSLTEEEARELVRLAPLGMQLAVKPLRAFILRTLPVLRGKKELDLLMDPIRHAIHVATRGEHVTINVSDERKAGFVILGLESRGRRDGSVVWYGRGKRAGSVTVRVVGVGS